MDNQNPTNPPTAPINNDQPGTPASGVGTDTPPATPVTPPTEQPTTPSTPPPAAPAEEKPGETPAPGATPTA